MVAKFSNLDTTTCNPLSNQNQIFDLIREEAEHNNDELFKYFGSFLNLKLSNEQSILVIIILKPIFSIVVS